MWRNWYKRYNARRLHSIRIAQLQQMTISVSETPSVIPTVVGTPL